MEHHIIIKERIEDVLNKKAYFVPLIQHTFGFSELNKVASGMGIQSSPFSSANWLCKAFVGLIS